MATREFVQACKKERDALMALYADRSSGSVVGAHLDAAQLTPPQRIEVLAALNVALTDTFYTLLMGLCRRCFSWWLTAGVSARRRKFSSDFAIRKC